jgi:hypothetical protein
MGTYRARYGGLGSFLKLWIPYHITNLRIHNFKNGFLFFAFYHLSKDFSSADLFNMIYRFKKIDTVKKTKFKSSKFEVNLFSNSFMGKY